MRCRGPCRQNTPMPTRPQWPPHTSGLPEIIDSQGAFGGATEPEAWSAVEARPLEVSPGEQFSYNQTNYGLLSRIIVKLSGQPYERLVTQRQLDGPGGRSPPS